jgi:hypothetical protein
MNDQQFHALTFPDLSVLWRTGEQEITPLNLTNPFDPRITIKTT